MAGKRIETRILAAVTGSLVTAMLTGTCAAATITVNSTSDAVNPSDGLCTLREAIVSATSNGPSGNVDGECAGGRPYPTTDTIEFAIPGTGVRTIVPTAPFPAIADSVIIDGYTQSGASPNTLEFGSNAVLKVEIDAANAGTAPVFRFIAGSFPSHLRGLVVNGFSERAIALDGAAGVHVEGNFLGTDVAGTTLAGSGGTFVVHARSASAIFIGGTGLADRNVIAGGSGAQVYAEGGLNILVLGNLIGTDAPGTAALRPVNPGVGVWLRGTRLAEVGRGFGGETTGNVISGNAKGIVLEGGSVRYIKRNRIGTDATGTKPVPNESHGIEIASPGPGIVGGTPPGEGNLVAFNGGAGIRVASGSGWRIVGYATFGNADKGISLYAGPLPLANDPLDLDSGANDRQNFPLIDSVTLSPTSVRLQGRVEGVPGRTLVLDVYGAPPLAQPTDFLQGRTYIGAAPAALGTDGQGRATFDVTLPYPASSDLHVTATLTDVTGCGSSTACGSTSEFSQRGVFAVAPRWGSATSQLPFALTGHLFQPQSTLALGSTNAPGVTFVDAQHLDGSLPVLTPGTSYDVTVTHPDASRATMPRAFFTDFLDVDPGSPFYAFVMGIAANGITSGCGNGYYCAGSEVSRAQMAVFLLRGRYGPFFVPPPAVGVFADVPAGTVTADWIELLRNEGITSGCTATPMQYCPGAAVTRAQMAVFLLRTKHGATYVPPPCTGTFADVACAPPRHPFADWIEQLAREGVTLGCATNPLRYCPDASVLRLQMAAFLSRTFGLDAGSSSTQTVSVKVDSPIAGGESFEFGLGDQRIAITQGGVAVPFPTPLAAGSAYTVSQLAGARPCAFWGNFTGTIGADDVLVTADCGRTPAPRTVSVRIDTPVAPGESFQFSLGAQSTTVTQGDVPMPFPNPLAEGTAYALHQTAGPRQCAFPGESPYHGTVAATDVLIFVICGFPPARSGLSGILVAPHGKSVTLRNNGGDDLALTLLRVTQNWMPFTFATALYDGAAYAVTVASMSADQSCAVYMGATGTMPVADGALRVGCEHAYDLVSRSSNDSVRGSYVESSAPAIGGDGAEVGGWGEGQFVVFASSAPRMYGSTTGAYSQIYWRSRDGFTYLVSANQYGEEGNGNSFAPAISSDGQTVVFESYATNLVDGDTNGVRDVFFWTTSPRWPPIVRRLSVGAGGTQADGESFEPTVSGDGRIVAFSTSASNLTGGVSGTSTINVVRQDVATGTNTLVSRGAIGARAGLGVGGRGPTLSYDGNRLALHSTSQELVAGDTNGRWDIFVYQHDDGSMRRVSLTETGSERDQGSESASHVAIPAISGNGRYVAYATTATNVVSGDTNGAQDVFVVDVDGGSVHRASVATGGAQGNGSTPITQGERAAISHDGTWVAFTTAASNLGVPAHNVVMHNIATGETRGVSNNSVGTGPPSISRNAAYVVYGSATAQDGRFAENGLFARFTNLAPAYFWYTQ